jgi:hypothetical protein
VFSTPASVAEAIAGALGINVPSGERTGGRTHAAKRATYDPIAYDEYVRGRRRLDTVGTLEDFETARQHLERAVARDPTFAPAYEALAMLHWWQGYFGLIPPKDAFAAGILHAIRVLEIDGSRAEAYALLAQYRKQLDYDWPGIERELTRALELDRNSPFVRVLYALGWLMPQARIQDAIREIECALEWDPLWVPANVLLGVMLALTRQWDAVIDRGRLMTEVDPASHWGHWILGFGLRGKGLLDDAIAAQRKAVDLSGGYAMMLGWFGLVLGSGGGEDEARGVLGRLQAMARTTYVPPTSFAWIYLGLRDVDRAFEWLDRAIDARNQLMMPIRTYAFFDPIRNDPRFHALLRKMKLDT